ncbi:hypothetical protein [Desulfolutivibrio sulfoxidireducens]|uniref:hypothetical protein n=1 Tax=Desulfolutivibrio sulfoxidireducens TaxID=2773299 RepID=UPI00159D8BD7|nr:hypothetical protein [Desulfolutivibrio sulfoxidireducens]QLA20974.1 hypothetical protein GD604_15215 [Desulfolutivibrio sulfoxidireducens]
MDDVYRVSYMGDGRSFFDGFKYGNYGGKNWTGGQNPNAHNGEDGDAIPIDYSYWLYKKHDDLEQGNYSDEEKKNLKNIADKELVEDLKQLTSDSFLWLYPPQNASSAEYFRDAAIRFFSGEEPPTRLDHRYNSPLPDILANSRDEFELAMGTFSPGDPLIFDLNGYGVNTVSLNDSKAFFDIDGDGFAERTEWASGNEGMLAVDANENGLIDDVSELFGNDTAANGIAKLKYLRQVVDQRQTEMLCKAA